MLSNKRETDPLLPKSFSTTNRPRLQAAIASIALTGVLFLLFAILHTPSPAVPLASTTLLAGTTLLGGSVQAENEAAQQILSMMDTSINPCDDFWQFSCGGFLKNTPVKGDIGRFGIAEQIAENSQNALHTIIEELSAKDQDKLTSSQHRLVTFYSSCLDLDTINKLGVKPIHRYLDHLSEADTFSELLELTAILHRNSKKSESRQSTILYTRPFFSWDVQVNLNNIPEMILSFSSDGTSFPDTSYYLQSAYAHLLPKFIEHVHNMFILSGLEPEEAAKAAPEVVNFEIHLAKLQEASGNSKEKIHTIAELKKLTPNIDWESYLKTLFYDTQLPTPKHIHFDNFLYFELLDKLTTKIDFEVLRNYLRFHLVHLNARFLSEDFIKEDFRFFGVQVTGANPDVQVERWRECVRMSDSNLPDDLGQEFISNLFTRKSKIAARVMLEDIEHAFGEIITEDSWIGLETQTAALDKLAQIGNRVYSTDHWDNYTGLHVDSNAYAENVFTLRGHQSYRLLSQISRGHNGELWGMSPPSVNAYYDPTWNEMVFPAGIFRPTYYSVYQPDAYNYGALGVTMGHELGHAFDSNGRQYDGKGYKRDWMSKKAIKSYNERAQCVIDLFNTYKVANLSLDGELTLDENLADLSGVKTSLRAYLNHRKSLEAEGKLQNEDRLISLLSLPNLTPEQLYFIAYGQSWCEVETEAYQIRSTKEVHAPAKWRVVGPISQSPEFARAFNCPALSAMNPPLKCEIW